MFLFGLEGGCEQSTAWPLGGQWSSMEQIVIAKHVDGDPMHIAGDRANRKAGYPVCPGAGDARRGPGRTSSIALMRPWRFSSAIGVVYKLALVGSILAVAVLFAWGAFLIGIGTMLEHPRYRHHVVCEPCF